MIEIYGSLGNYMRHSWEADSPLNQVTDALTYRVILSKSLRYFHNLVYLTLEDIGKLPRSEVHIESRFKWLGFTSSQRRRLRYAVLEAKMGMDS